MTVKDETSSMVSENVVKFFKLVCIGSLAYFKHS